MRGPTLTNKVTALLCIDPATKRVRRYEPIGNHKVRVTAELEIVSQPPGIVGQLALFLATPASFEIWRPEPTEAA